METTRERLIDISKHWDILAYTCTQCGSITGIDNIGEPIQESKHKWRLFCECGHDLGIMRTHKRYKIFKSKAAGLCWLNDLSSGYLHWLTDKGRGKLAQDEAGMLEAIAEIIKERASKTGPIPTIDERSAQDRLDKINSLKKELKMVTERWQAQVKHIVDNNQDWDYFKVKNESSKARIYERNVKTVESQLKQIK